MQVNNPFQYKNAKPDYTSRIAYANNKPHIMPSSGCICGWDKRQDGYAMNVEVLINGVNVRIVNLQTNFAYNSWSYEVKKGDVVQLKTNGVDASFFFAPCLGEVL